MYRMGKKPNVLLRVDLHVEYGVDIEFVFPNVQLKQAEYKNGQESERYVVEHKEVAVKYSLKFKCFSSTRNNLKYCNVD